MEKVKIKEFFGESHWCAEHFLTPHPSGSGEVGKPGKRKFKGAPHSENLICIPKSFGRHTGLVTDSKDKKPKGQEAEAVRPDSRTEKWTTPWEWATRSLMGGHGVKWGRELVCGWGRLWGQTVLHLVWQDLGVATHPADTWESHHIGGTASMWVFLKKDRLPGQETSRNAGSESGWEALKGAGAEVVTQESRITKYKIPRHIWK